MPKEPWKERRVSYPSGKRREEKKTEKKRGERGQPSFSKPAKDGGGGGRPAEKEKIRKKGNGGFTKGDSSTTGGEAI